MGEVPQIFQTVAFLKPSQFPNNLPPSSCTLPTPPHKRVTGIDSLTQRRDRNHFSCVMVASVTHECWFELPGMMHEGFHLTAPESYCIPCPFSHPDASSSPTLGLSPPLRNKYTVGFVFRSCYLLPLWFCVPLQYCFFHYQPQVHQRGGSGLPQMQQ